MGAIFDRHSSRLYLYSSGATEVRAPWRAPMAWRKYNHEPNWRHVRPDLKLPGRPVEGELKRFHAPERATLAVRRTYRGWRVVELSGRRNKPVSSATRSLVQKWFDSAAGPSAAAG